MMCKLCGTRKQYKYGICSICLMPDQRQQAINEFKTIRRTVNSLIELGQRAGKLKETLDQFLEEDKRIKLTNK